MKNELGTTAGGGGFETVFSRFTTSDIQEAISRFPQILPEAINILLNDPFVSVWEEVGRQDRIRALFTIITASTLPPHAPQFKEGFTALKQALEPDQTEPSSGMPRRFAAFLIAEALLYQTALPIGKKDVVRFERDSEQREEKRAALRLIHASLPPDQQTEHLRASLSQATTAFRQELTKLAQPAQNEEETRLQLSVYEMVNRMAGISNGLYQQLATSDPRFTRWLVNRQTQAVESLSASPFSAVLFQEDRFDQEVSGIPILVNIFAAQARLPGTGEILAKYFLTHPKLQQFLWDEIETSLAPSVHFDIISWFFEQDSPTLDRFIDTIPMTKAGIDQQISYLLLFVTAYAIFKTDFPEHQNVSYLTETIHRLAEQTHTTDYLREWLAVLEDKKAGAAYLKEGKGLAVESPRPGETRGEFLHRMQKGPKKIYVSTVSLPETAPAMAAKPEILPAAQAAAREVAKPMVTSGATSSLWGEMQVASDEDMPQVVNWLDRQLSQAGVRLTRPVEASREVVIYQQQPPVILPEILPRNNPASQLARIGVIAIEQNPLGQVILVLDRQRAKITTGEQKGQEKIAVSLVLDGLPNSALGSLVRSAVTFSTLKPTAPSLIDNLTIREVHGVMNSWNRQAKRNHLPELHYDLPAGSRSVGQVVTLVGNKPVFLHLIA